MHREENAPGGTKKRGSGKEKGTGGELRSSYTLRECRVRSYSRKKKKFFSRIRGKEEEVGQRVGSGKEKKNPEGAKRRKGRFCPPWGYSVLKKEH